MMPPQKFWLSKFYCNFVFAKKNELVLAKTTFTTTKFMSFKRFCVIWHVVLLIVVLIFLLLWTFKNGGFMKRLVSWQILDMWVKKERFFSLKLETIDAHEIFLARSQCLQFEILEFFQIFSNFLLLTVKKRHTKVYSTRNGAISVLLQPQIYRYLVFSSRSTKIQYFLDKVEVNHVFSSKLFFVNHQWLSHFLLLLLQGVFWFIIFSKLFLVIILCQSWLKKDL